MHFNINIEAYTPSRGLLDIVFDGICDFFCVHDFFACTLSFLCATSLHARLLCMRVVVFSGLALVFFSGLASAYLSTPSHVANKQTF
jgi:hypothetical protein